MASVAFVQALIIVRVVGLLLHRNASKSKLIFFLLLRLKAGLVNLIGQGRRERVLFDRLFGFFFGGVSRFIKGELGFVITFLSVE